MQRRKLFSGWLTSLFLCSLLFSPSAQATTPTNVFLSEVAWAGSSLSASDEWIELANPTDETLNLSGWQISGAASSGNILTLPEGSLIAPQSTLLISNYDTVHENAAMSVTPSYVTSSISLSNSALQITLSTAQGEIIDMIGDGKLPLAGTSGGTSLGGAYASMQRIYPLYDGTLPEAWTTATAQIGIKEGVVDLATPGSYSFETTVAEVLSEEITDDIPEVIEEPVIELPSEPETIVSPLFISEFVSDPSEGKVEFIELYNNSDLPLDLTGYTITDAAGKITTLEGTVTAQNYYLVSEPAGKLNNDGDTIVLADPHGTIVETIVYGTDDLPSLSDPSAYARTQEDTFIASTTSTPGTMNLFTTELPEITIEEESVEEETIIETENVEDTTSVLSYQSNDLLLNEFVSSPLEGEVEWVEIYHPGTEEIVLIGWTLEDATGKQTALGEGMLSPASYLIITSPKGVLNNDGDTLILKDGQGNVIDTLVYGTAEIPAPKKGYALAKTSEGTWQETETSTPGTVNTLSTTEETTTDTASSSASETQEETAVSYDYSALRLSEIYPNTDGSDEVEEFIEIENVGDTTIDLFGVILEDASGKQFVFSEHQNLLNVSMITLTRALTGIALNNLGDTVLLYDPSYQLLDQVTYEKTNQGQSLARIHGSWDWTTNPSANEPNTFPTAQVDIPVTTTVASTIISAGAKTTTTTSVDRSNTTSLYLLKTIGQAQNLLDDTRVQVTGIVSVVPGVLGKQIFYLQDETGGIQIYQYDADFPSLQEGDVVTLKGIMSTSREERRIKVSGQQDITLQETVLAPESVSIPLDIISEKEAGILVSISGIVVSKENSSILLEENGAQLTVRLASSTGLTPANFSTGARVVVTGILAQYNDDLVLLPRSIKDVETLASTAEEVTISGLTAQQQTYQRIALTLASITIIILAGFALSHYAPHIKSYVTHRPIRLGTQKTH